MPSKFRERVKVGVDKHGVAVYEWARGNSKQELYQNIADILNGHKNKTVSWYDYSQQWFEIYHLPNLRAKTVVKDTSIMKRHIRPAFGFTDISQITLDDVQRYLLTKANYSKSQVRDVMWMLKAVFSAAVDDGIITRNPMLSDRISNTSKVISEPRQALSPDAQMDIIEHIDELEEPNARRLMAFLMFTSMRPCEIYGLMWEDVDTESGIIHVNRDLVFVNGIGMIDETKTTESVRTITIDKRLMKYLETDRREGYVICMTGDRFGKHLTSESVARHLWQRIGKKIDLHGMTPYMGRHTFATNMSRAGVPIRTAMSIMGHKDERMLLRTYQHVNQEDLLTAGNVMSDYYEGLEKRRGSRCAPKKQAYI